MAGEEESVSIVEQARGALDSIPAPVKLGAIAVIGLFFIWVLWGFVSGVLTQWEPLSMQVSGGQKAEIIEYLRTENINYKIEGDSVLVPADQAAELRITLLGQGYDATPLLGLERLKEVTMGQTEKTIAAQRQLAFEEEIKRNLLMVRSIRNAEVNLSLPSDSAFYSRQQVPAKASLTLDISPTFPLESSKIRGIQLAVANSVQGLSPNDVVIIDQEGNQLTEDSDMNSRFNSVQLEEEQRIINEVEKIFTPVLGKDRVQVSANVQIDRSKEVITDRQIDVNSPATITSRTVESEEQRPTLGGQPGTETNTGDPNTTTQGGLATTTKSEEETQTEYSQTVTRRETDAGGVKRKSVAVIIDLKEQQLTSEDGDTTTEWVSWGDEALQNWEEAIRRAAGIISEQDGQVSLMEISFEDYHRMRERMEMKEQSVQTRRLFNIFDWSDWTALIKIPLLIVIVFLIFWFVLRPVGRLVLEPILSLPSQTEAEIPEELPKTVEELEAEIEGKIEDEIDIASKEVTKGTILKKRVSELAKNEPEGFTQLIRTWMNEQ